MREGRGHSCYLLPMPTLVIVIAADRITDWASAFVNWRRIEVGEEPMLALILVGRF